MSVNKNLLIDAAIVVALLLVGAAGYFYSPLLLPKSDIKAAPADAGCDLQASACGAALPDGGRIELSISPRPIPNVKPLEVEVRVFGTAPDKVTLDFAGARMNMGVNRTDLAPVAPDRYAATTSLPVCVTGAMEWIATVIVERGRERISVPFRFTSLPH
ncbi:MAG TPA: hypothetical protein VF816_11410 [Rhodocyclaceae bacterium]